jgi:hypothetical protein
VICTAWLCYVLQMVSCTSSGSRNWQPCPPASSTCARPCTQS